MKFCLKLGVLLLCPLLPLGTGAQEIDLMLAAQLLTLEDPVVIETRRGQDFSGKVESLDAGKLSLSSRVGEGEVIFTFEQTEILRVRFPGNELRETALEWAELGDYEAALSIINKLFAQRQPLFPLVGVDEVGFFVQTLPLYRAAGRLQEAYDRIAALRPFIKDTAALRLLQAEQLLLGQQLGLREETKALARAWIVSEGREVQNALGSCLLAVNLLDEGLAEEALQTALFPILFSRSRSIPYLDHCYAVALELAHFLEQTSTVDALRIDFERRGYAVSSLWNEISPPDFGRLHLPKPPQ